ncbi:MAG: (Fe-S)-binding protein [Archaeoglobus sp.]|nr:MAG: (Fe-S)-binding protein [Archaeoglobus sp.]
MEIEEMLENLFKRMEEVPDYEKFFQCIQCGVCGGSCPYSTGTVFTPRRMVLAIRAGIVNEVIESFSHWLCSSCFTCSLRCPSRVPITDAVIPALRELSLLQGNPPEELASALISIARYGNPFKKSPRKRDDWTKEVEFEVPLMAKKKSAEVMFLTGCYGAYHSRCRKITKSLAKIMHMIGTDFAILGNEERCIGDLARLNGEFGLFEELAEKNIRTFSKYSFSKIVTHDAHAYNALIREYTKFGFGKEVLHHTQFLHKNLERLKEMFNSLDYTVTYHDSCYVGRRNGIYEEPREVIRSIPKLKFVEMKRNRENALCCGGGSGIWLDSVIKERVKYRPAESRVKEAFSVGADILVTACPLDVPMFEDALKVTDLEGKLEIMDISELVLNAIEG